ncbi:MerR family transcriptional regulator [Peredibacter starrii]|uniref:MerR family transcriptional regulator n=1 Tax=Peredibacter starrii TaxID=28202 RepID=A0AAX4HLE5_9BACT|nr:MerR family transcriptional regulator [Peredibacter starrii]WPU64021.1 MerR family transcriptional regulator [Peredibacter starrii]
MSIPNKSNFKFQELTPITGVKPYVIRYWETEFPEIAPFDSEGGQKIYARKDVEAILRIKKLLFEEKLSIPEAKARMQAAPEEAAVAQVPAPVVDTAAMENVKNQILKSLDFIRDIKFKRKW